MKFYIYLCTWVTERDLTKHVLHYINHFVTDGSLIDFESVELLLKHILLRYTLLLTLFLLNTRFTYYLLLFTS